MGRYAVKIVGERTAGVLNAGSILSLNPSLFLWSKVQSYLFFALLTHIIAMKTLNVAFNGFITYLLLFFCCFLLVQISFAHSPRKSDPDAKVYLDKLSAKYKAMKTIKADFKLAISQADQKKPEVQTGKLYVKGTKYKIVAKDLERVSDGKSVWTHFVSQQEVQVTKLDAKELSPAQFFGIYAKDFTYYVSDEKANSIEIDLTPIDKKASYYKVRLTIDKTTNALLKGILFDKSGLRYAYELQNLQANTSILDSFFVFDAAKYPEAELIDLR